MATHYRAFFKTVSESYVTGWQPMLHPEWPSADPDRRRKILHEAANEYLSFKSIDVTTEDGVFRYLNTALIEWIDLEVQSDT